jgi:DNA-binding NarL/FixJ family response regulator
MFLRARFGHHQIMPRSPGIVRVAFLGVSPLLRDMLTPAFDGELVLEAIGDYADLDSLINALPAISPDVVLIAAGRMGTKEVARRCLSVAPKMSVVTLTRDDRDAVIYRLDLSWTTVEEISPQMLVEEVRKAVSTSW